MTTVSLRRELEQVVLHYEERLPLAVNTMALSLAA